MVRPERGRAAFLRAPPDDALYRKTFLAVEAFPPLPAPDRHLAPTSTLLMNGMTSIPSRQPLQTPSEDEAGGLSDALRCQRLSFLKE